MKNKRLLGLYPLLGAALVLLACDPGSLVVALNPSTATPSRTPRPTFTPRPAETDTPEATSTPEATDTPEASPTPTKRAVTIVRTATKPPPTAIPPPKFAWTVKPEDGDRGFCPNGTPVYEIKGRIWANNDYLGGAHLVLIDHSGKIVAQGNSWPRDQMNLEWGVSCISDKNLFNYQIDGTAGWSNGPLILRLTKSSGDLTPTSPDVPITWDAAGGRYYIDFVQ